jgi:hypothetical protein
LGIPPTKNAYCVDQALSCQHPKRPDAGISPSFCT